MAEKYPLVSIVITTRNEERNIINCLESIEAQTWPNVEVIVVDNQSTDATKELAQRFTDKVFDQGPERSAQRNFGIIDVASGDYAMFIDADMLLTPSVVEKCVETMNSTEASGLHIEEIVLGRGFLADIRRYERSFYSGTVVDGIRFFRRDVFIEIGGFDQALPPGPEDWDLDKRFKSIGPLVLMPSSGGKTNEKLESFVRARGVVPAPTYVGIYHNEDEQKLQKYLSKKGYYSNSMQVYVDKWGPNDPDVRKQLGFRYRFVTVFTEKRKYRKALSRPHLLFSMIVLRGLVGLTYIYTTRRKP